MKSLRDLAWLDIGLEGNDLRFGRGLPAVTPVCRTLAEARYAFAEDAVEGPDDLYYMYRDLARLDDRRVTGEYGLRYDVTVILPGFVGREFNKTVGHYHSVKPGTRFTYPEVYEVLHGQATYLLQRPGTLPGEVEDVVVFVADPGDKVVIPPGYGHITINADDEPLVMANWVASEFASVYGEIRELRGGAHYLLEGGEWVQNPLYKRVPEVRYEVCRDYENFGLIKGQGMYRLIVDAPERLRFLTHPEEFEWDKLTGCRRVTAATQ